MPTPLYERPDTEEEREYQRMLQQRLKAEEEQLYDNRAQGDYFGLEDGRPGMSIGPDFINGGYNLYMPFSWRMIIWFGTLALLALAAFGTRLCVGEERAQEYLRSRPSYQQAGEQQQDGGAVEQQGGQDEGQP